MNSTRLYQGDFHVEDHHAKRRHKASNTQPKLTLCGKRVRCHWTLDSIVPECQTCKRLDEGNDNGNE